MVLITIVTGAYKPTYNWGASHCMDGCEILHHLIDGLSMIIPLILYIYIYIYSYIYRLLTIVLVVDWISQPSSPFLGHVCVNQGTRSLGRHLKVSSSSARGWFGTSLCRCSCELWRFTMEFREIWANYNNSLT